MKSHEKFNILFLFLSFLLIFPSAVYSQGEEDNKTFDIKLSLFYTNGTYSNGLIAHNTSAYFIYSRENNFKAWMGYERVKNPDINYMQDIVSLGTYFHTTEKDAFQVDYFYIDDTLNIRTNVYSLEYFYQNDIGTMGLAYNFSNYPEKNVHQIIPRFVYPLSPELWATTKFYLTITSNTNLAPWYDPAAGENGIAMWQKMVYYVKPDFNINFGFSIGDRINAVENDTSSVFTQPDIMDGSLFTGISYNPSEKISFKIQYEYDHFRHFTIKYITAGAGIKW